VVVVVVDRIDRVETDTHEVSSIEIGAALELSLGRERQEQLVVGAVLVGRLATARQLGVLVR